MTKKKREVFFYRFKQKKREVKNFIYNVALLSALDCEVNDTVATAGSSSAGSFVSSEIDPEVARSSYQATPISILTSFRRFSSGVVSWPGTPLPLTSLPINQHLAR